jgi:hypothetical protein
VGCFLEVFRSRLLVPEAEVQTRRISRLELPEILLADCTSSRSRGFGVTAEIHSMVDYAIPQRWAAALAEAGFDGIYYLLRHDPGQLFAGIALFGPAGAPSWETPPEEPIGLPVLEAVEHRFGIRVLPTL